MYLNKAIILGNLTRDPEMRSMPSGASVTSFSLATNRVWKDKEGNKQESTDYHNIVVFGRQAETSAQYLKKGQSVLIEGRIQTRSWEAEGVKKYRTEIAADRGRFGQKAGGETEGALSVAPAAGSSAQAKKATADTIDYPEEDINLDDIPF